MEVGLAASPRPHGGRLAGLLAAAALAFLPAASRAADEAAPPERVLRVATSGDYEPFSLRRDGDASPSFEGFDIDVAMRFAADHGYRVEFVPFRWPDLARELAAGRFDVAMSGVTMRTDRSLAGRFTVPVAATHAVAITWKGSGAATLEELDRPQRRVAVNAGGHLEKVADARLRRAHVIALADNSAVRMAMLDRAFDAVVTEDIEAARWSAATSGTVRIGPLSDDRKAYLLPADRGELAMQLDLWLLAREKDGTLAELRRRHFAAGAASAAAAPGTTAVAGPVEALAAAVGERLALMPLVYETKQRTGAPIEDGAREDAVLDAAVEAVGRAAALSAREAGSDGAALPVPDEGQVRFLFRALMEAGKDVQVRLAEADAKRRTGTVVQRTGAGPSPDATEESRARAREADARLRETLRPAIGRITDRIACILVAMDEKLSVEEASRRLRERLPSREIGDNRVDAIASAVARISSRRPAR